jgi:hypothetical protein
VSSDEIPAAPRRDEFDAGLAMIELLLARSASCASGLLEVEAELARALRCLAPELVAEVRRLQAIEAAWVERDAEIESAYKRLRDAVGKERE